MPPSHLIMILYEHPHICPQMLLLWCLLSTVPRPSSWQQCAVSVNKQLQCWDIRCSVVSPGLFTCPSPLLWEGLEAHWVRLAFCQISAERGTAEPSFVTWFLGTSTVQIMNSVINKSVCQGVRAWELLSRVIPCICYFKVLMFTTNPQLCMLVALISYGTTDTSFFQWFDLLPFHLMRK